MKNVYIGKPIGERSFQHCLVIDSDISTASAVVFNLATEKLEVLKFGEWMRIGKPFQELSEEIMDTCKPLRKKALKAINEYQNSINLFWNITI